MGSDAIYNQPVVLDNGSSVIKSGFSGQNKPQCFEYNLIGTPKYEKVMLTNAISNNDLTYIGNRAQKSRGLLRLRHPMNRGIVENWDDMETLWSHTFNDILKINDFDEHPLLITEAPLNPEKNRDKMCEVFFEKFDFAAVYIANPSTLSLYASGRTTGCVLDCGDGYCSSVPIYEGFALPSSIRRIDVGGRDVTEQLQFQIRKYTGISLYSSSEHEIVRNVKEKACYVSTDFAHDEDMSNLNPEKIRCQFKLPDGKDLILDKARFRAPEILFRPQIMGLEYDSVSDMCFESISKVDLELRPKLFSSIILNGGSTMFRGFGDRLLKELQIRTGNKNLIKIIAPPERKYTSWIGGSILTGLSTFKQLWMTKAEWQEDNNLRYRF